MIYYVATERFSSTIRRFLRSHGKALGGILKSLTWEELFFERGGPVGHYIFTDFDRLSRYELECAAAFAMALEKAAPEARILNHPLRALERFPLLVALHQAGINDFTATRVEAGERPPKYPVFIRAEDGYGGPETDIISDDAEDNSALANLARRGLPLRGRIAIGYAAERGEDGYFQKFGAFNVAGEILAHHRMSGPTWVVKSNFKPTAWGSGRDAAVRIAEESMAKELDYVRSNPHRDILAKAFAVAGIEFGRADYGIVNGRVQIYEINTNARMPGPLKDDPRNGWRKLSARNFISAVEKIEQPLNRRGRISFRETRPRAHDVHLPRWRLPASLLRRLKDSLSRRGRRSDSKAEHD